jgi:hypothetical protein
MTKNAYYCVSPNSCNDREHFMSINNGVEHNTFIKFFGTIQSFKADYVTAYAPSLPSFESSNENILFN